MRYAPANTLFSMRLIVWGFLESETRLGMFIIMCNSVAYNDGVHPSSAY